MSSTLPVQFFEDAKGRIAPFCPRCGKLSEQFTVDYGIERVPIDSYPHLDARHSGRNTYRFRCHGEELTVELDTNQTPWEMTDFRSQMLDCPDI